MVSIQPNYGGLKGFKYHPVHPRGDAINKKTGSNLLVKNSMVQFGLEIRTHARQTIGDQTAVFHFHGLTREEKAALVYNQRPVSDLSADEAQNLIKADGYFGIDKTSQRIADFVLTGAGDDIDRLKAGREGVLRGFEAAEKAWGGKLPDISYDTLARSLDAIDEKIRDHGGKVIDLST